MTDAFAEFGFERRPWLDPGEIQARYHELASLRHPDRCGGDPVPLARLNEARRILASHSSRLRHLLPVASTVEMSGRSFQPDFDLFSLVGMLVRKAGVVSAKRDGASTELASTIAGMEAAALEKEIEPVSCRIACLLDDLEEKIRRLDALWPAIAPQELATLAEEAAFYQKWKQSLEDAKTLLLGG